MARAIGGPVERGVVVQNADIVTGEPDVGFEATSTSPNGLAECADRVLRAEATVNDHTSRRRCIRLCRGSSEQAEPDHTQRNDESDHGLELLHVFP